MATTPNMICIWKYKTVWEPAIQGDQEMILEEAGPVQERRMSVRPAFDDGTPGFPHMYEFCDSR